MIKCENECPKNEFSGCCFICPNKVQCSDACDSTPEECGQAVYDESTGSVAFKDNSVAAIQAVCDVIAAKKEMETKEKELKDKLKQAMEKYGVKKFECEQLTITYIAETTAVSVDTAKLKKLHPDVAEECSKTSVKSAYIKVEVAEGVK